GIAQRRQKRLDLRPNARVPGAGFLEKRSPAGRRGDLDRASENRLHIRAGAAHDKRLREGLVTLPCAFRGPRLPGILKMTRKRMPLVGRVNSANPANPRPAPKA